MTLHGAEVTRADVDVQPYAFTTKSLFVGHTDHKYLRWQIIDTPGLLDRPLEERNTIEMQVLKALQGFAVELCPLTLFLRLLSKSMVGFPKAPVQLQRIRIPFFSATMACFWWQRASLVLQSITALAHLRAAVLYVVDISEQCGYTIQQQAALFHSIKPLFSGKPLLVVLNKIDAMPQDSLAEADRAALQEMAVEALRSSAAGMSQSPELALWLSSEPLGIFWGAEASLLLHRLNATLPQALSISSFEITQSSIMGGRNQFTCQELGLGA